MGYKRITVHPLSESLGAEVGGVDLTQRPDSETLSELVQVFAAHGLIFFRDQAITPEQHIQFAETWGRININRFFASVEGYPSIAEVRKEPDEKFNIGGGWHADHSYDQIPALGAILVAKEVPDSGGDTLFASMYAAYEGLSAGLKRTLEGLEAEHSSRHVFGIARLSRTDLKGRIGNAEAATQDAIHPVVITHPLSGRKALYVNPGFTVRFRGWTETESAPLLKYLYEHATRPEYTCRFNWKVNSIAFWDNRATWHYALNDYAGKRRLMHRITLEGVPVSA